MKKQFSRVLPWLLGLILISACKRNDIHYLQANGASFMQNMSTGRTVNADSPYAPITPVMHGDLIWLPGQCFIKFSGEKDRTIEFTMKGPKTFIDGHLASVLIDDSTKVLDTVQYQNLSKLQSLHLSIPVYDAMMPALKQISTKKHNVGLIYTDETDTSDAMIRNYESLETLLKLFDPDWLITYMKAGKTELLATEQQLDMLYLILEDTVINYQLPQLKKLRHLTIVSENAIVPANFLDANPHITDFVIEGQFDPGLLTKVKKVKSLFLRVADSIRLDLRKDKGLERLSIQGPDGIPAIEVGTYQHLTWLDLPEKETQQQFDSITNSNSGIKVIEFSGDSLIRDLSGAAKWKQLRAMIIYGDTLYAKAGLTQLQQLKLLSLPAAAFKDSINIAGLRRSLPNTAIIPNDGACVGSGWLLLLIPLVVLIRLGFKKPLA
jgi:hypothetical protein